MGRKKFLLAFLLFLSFGLNAQELAYNNNISDYLQLNPAFAGSKSVYRAALNNQLRWYGALHHTFYNSFSFDFNSRKLPRLGWGIQAQYNQLSTGFVNSAASISLAYRLGKLRKFIFIPAVKFSYKGYYLNTNDLVFYDQLSVYDGIYSESAAQLEVKNFHLFNISAGFVSQFPINFNTTMPIWVNFGFYLDNIPKLALVFNNTSLLYYPLKRVYHAGILIPILHVNQKTQLHDFRGFYVYPNIRYLEQGNYNLITLSTLVYKKPFIVGIGHENFKTLSLFNKNQFVGTVGYQGHLGNYLTFEFLYTFDLGISINNNSPLFVTHEISLVINFVNRRKNDCKGKLKYNQKRWYSNTEDNSWHQGECPPGKTKRRTFRDIFPSFYPIELPKPYIPNEKSIF